MAAAPKDAEAEITRRCPWEPSLASEEELRFRRVFLLPDGRTTA
jgi:hypothetical protein